MSEKREYMSEVRQGGYTNRAFVRCDKSVE